MKRDTSRKLYDKYFSLGNRSIEVLLKNGRILEGTIIGYYAFDEDADDTPIHHWHMIDEKQQYCPAFSCLGLIRGELIRHSDIVSVTFHEDNSIMNF